MKNVMINDDFKIKYSDDLIIHLKELKEKENKLPFLYIYIKTLQKACVFSAEPLARLEYLDGSLDFLNADTQLPLETQKEKIKLKLETSSLMEKSDPNNPSTANKGDLIFFIDIFPVILSAEYLQYFGLNYDTLELQIKGRKKKKKIKVLQPPPIIKNICKVE
ncbi:MAG: hypothetical protein ACTSU2_14130 [Promethearchaeota archaeon]